MRPDYFQGSMMYILVIKHLSEQIAKILPYMVIPVQGLKVCPVWDLAGQEIGPDGSTYYYP